MPFSISVVLNFKVAPKQSHDASVTHIGTDMPRLKLIDSKVSEKMLANGKYGNDLFDLSDLENQHGYN